MSINYRCDACKMETGWVTSHAMPDNWNTYGSAYHRIDLCPDCATRYPERHLREVLREAVSVKANERSVTDG